VVSLHVMTIVRAVTVGGSIGPRHPICCRVAVVTSVRAVDVPLTSVDRWLIGLVLCLSLELTSVVT